ncbi:helix-turn-helix domain-containing protein [Ferrimonas aestuarii]|uniref:AraC family transcriptional regulator n=1 Tax=Ferrimonas aestuarii TaxID=2569539 RepID=A0A4U1BKF2_9GAMM|nr:AraC family transcriptional regulator [Ferrimonas aestuarii]TKB51713.1 AraC family transcriptional regulator [Ferrimonas aestuarii]
MECSKQKQVEVAPELVMAALKAAKTAGVDVDELLRPYNQSWGQLKAGQGLAGSSYAKLLRGLWRALDDESSGYAIRPLRVGSFRMLCHACIHCHNLRRVLLRAMAFFSLLSEQYQWRLVEQGEEAKLQLRMSGATGIDDAFFHLSLAVILHRWSAWMVDSPILLSRVSFAFPESEFGHLIPNMLQAPVEFNAPETELVIPIQYLQQPIKQTPESLTPFLANSPEQLLTLYRSDDSVSAQVKQFLEQQPELEEVNQDAVAQYFNVSVATLGRRLKREGHHFLQLKDKVRRGRAIRLLLHTQDPISGIAEQLGYSEPSVFYRNFKKWVGCTPAEFREQNQ